MAAKMTDRMAKALFNASGNKDGHYASNLGQGGGTGGALLRRGLIEPCADGYRVSAAGYKALEDTAGPVTGSGLADPEKYTELRKLLKF